MSFFLVDGKFITDNKQIREMWAGHFDELGTPSDNIQFDSDFCVTANVQETFILASVSFWPLLIIESVARVSQHVLFTHELLVKRV